MNKNQPTMQPAQTAWRCLLGLTMACAAAISLNAEEYTKVKPYAVAVSADYVIQPLLSVGDQVPKTGDPTKTYQMVGIPDGLGVTKGPGNTTILFMNHELTNGTLSEPNVGGPLNRGAFVSRWVLDKDACVVSGKRAYDTVHDEETGTVYPAAEVGNTTPGFGRFCSGSLTFKEAGFDRPIYFANEEGTGFDPKGQLAWAVFDNEIHSLAGHGRFPWENALVRPDAGEWTVVMGMEDGPSTPDNQLYMYVGRKSRAPGASVLSRNGLDTGKLYTFVADAGSPANETAFTSGSITGRWVELPDQKSRTAAQLEADSDAVGAFGFVRIEDGAWSKTDKNTFYFNTTGTGAPGTRLGNTYEVKFDKNNILGTTKITVIYNGDAVAAAGGDIAFAPDNMDTSKDYLMVCEDGTAQASPEYAKRARDGSIWRYDLKNNFAATRVAELNPPGTVIATPAPVPPAIPAGAWETSGIIDVSGFFGKNSWLFDVQAHEPAIAPAPNTVEDGQLLLMLPRLKGDDEDSD